MKALLFQSSALILLDCECRLCFNSYFTLKRLLRLTDLHVALGINIQMSVPEKNWLLLTTPVYTTYSRRFQPTPV
jgi:hypothetical protein